jgi:hypothetical protein
VLRRPSTHETAIWYLDNNVLIGGDAGPTLAPSWDLRCVADFNGDGKADYLLYNVNTQQTGLYYLNNNFPRRRRIIAKILFQLGEQNPKGAKRRIVLVYLRSL